VRRAGDRIERLPCGTAPLNGRLPGDPLGLHVLRAAGQFVLHFLPSRSLGTDGGCEFVMKVSMHGAIMA
jgi:hypothetical protein